MYAVKYDIIIYGSYHRGMPFYEYACEHYKPEEIVMICGEDLNINPKCNHKSHEEYSDKGHILFVREL